MKTILSQKLNQYISHDIEEYNFDKLAQELYDLVEMRKYLQEKEDNLKGRLETYLFETEQSSWVGEKFIFSSSIRKGSVDYSVIPELKQVDLEEYRKPSVTCWKLTKR